MVSQGSLKLKSASLLEMYDTVSAYEATVQDALYAQFKAAYTLSVTNYLRGNAGDAFKSYLSQGAVNMIQGILDVSSEMTMILQLITEIFHQYEKASDGVVEEGQLDDIRSILNGKQRTYDGMEGELASVMAQAARYISTTDLRFSEVDDAYRDTGKKMQQVREELYAADADAATSAGELLTRIQQMKNQITETMGLCYQDGSFVASNAASMTKQGWYRKQTNATLQMLMAEDPFEYQTGAVAISEDQWAAGLCSDVYAYAGYTFCNASYEKGKEGSSSFLKARASLLSVNAYAQLTDLVKAQGEAEVLYGDLETKTGLGENGYFGGRVTAEAGLLKVNGSAVVGTSGCNAYIKGDAKVLSANGKAAMEFESDGQFAVGVDGSASLGSASAEAGVNFLSYRVYDGTATGKEKDDLFKFSVTAMTEMGGSGAIYAESKTAIETDFVNINATTIKIKGAVLLGGCIQITVPTPYFKFPW